MTSDRSLLAQALLQLGGLKLLTGEFAVAAQKYRDVLDLLPADSRALCGLARCAIANTIASIDSAVARLVIDAAPGSLGKSLSERASLVEDLEGLAASRATQDAVNVGSAPLLPPPPSDPGSLPAGGVAGAGPATMASSTPIAGTCAGGLTRQQHRLLENLGDEQLKLRLSVQLQIQNVEELVGTIARLRSYPEPSAVASALRHSSLYGKIPQPQTLGISDSEMWTMALGGHQAVAEWRFRDARAIFTGLVTLAPEQPYFRTALGVVDLSDGDLDSALESFCIAVALHPGEHAAYVHAGEIRLRHGKLPAAVNDLRKALDLDPQNRNPLSARSQWLAATTLAALRKPRARTEPRPSANKSPPAHVEPVASKPLAPRPCRGLRIDAIHCARQHGVATVAKKLGICPNELAAWMREIPFTVDTMADLRLAYGHPLPQDFVFAVIYRNQAALLERCLTSLIAQNKAYDFAIALVDDGSTDDSIAVATRVLNGTGVPFVLASNTEPRYKARNLYNLVHHLVVKPNAVVLQVDGDDWLATDIDVLTRVNREYDRGALKTLGSFLADPSGDSAWHRRFHPHHLKRDVTQPWHTNRLTVWSHLKTFRRDLFLQVPMRYFLESDSEKWIEFAEDSCVTPMMVQLSRGKTAFITDVLYHFNMAGDAHEFASPRRIGYTYSKLYRAPQGSEMIGWIGDHHRRRRPALPSCAQGNEWRLPRAEEIYALVEQDLRGDSHTRDLVSLYEGDFRSGHGDGETGGSGCLSSGAVSESVAKLLYWLVRTLVPARTLSTSFGCGATAAWVAEAMDANGVGLHTAIAADFRERHGTAVLDLLDRLQLTARVQLLETSERIALQDVASENLGCYDIVFFEGENSLVELLYHFVGYVDRLLRPGGILAIVGCDTPPKRDLLKLIEQSELYAVTQLVDVTLCQKAGR